MKVTLTEYDYDLKETVTIVETDTHTIANSLTAETMAELLSDYVNNGAKDIRDGERIGDALTHTHRTLQRLIICWTIGILKELGDQEYIDARNEAAIETARKIGEMYDNGELSLGSFL